MGRLAEALNGAGGEGASSEVKIEISLRGAMRESTSHGVTREELHVACTVERQN